MNLLLEIRTGFLLAAALLWLAANHGAAAGPVMQVLKEQSSGTELLNNGNFEQASQGGFQNWVAAPEGFALGTGQGRSASQALRCENPSDKGWFGASQTLRLNRTQVYPLMVRGWSKAADVGGSPDSDYSLYVDIVYNDGTTLWGQTANFQTGTHDWQRRELVLLPEKPIKSLTLHCLFRRHSGTVWFDDVSVTETRTEAGYALFQGVPVTVAKTASQVEKKTDAAVYTTKDGLALTMLDDTVTSLKIVGNELVTNAPSGFLARDVAANSDVYGFENGECADLGLRLKVRLRAEPDHIVVEGRLADTSHKDRAVTLLFALPLDALGWQWGDDIRHRRVIAGEGESTKQVSTKCGATGTMSLYPLAALSNERDGIALAIDMGQPAQYRLGYQAATKQFWIAYDFGLVPETEAFPSAADFRFVLYRFEPHWGFRAAFQKLTTIFPKYFQVRSREQGLWMPFTDISKVEGWQDFGFRYHEGNNNVSWDDAHGVLSFRYTEPMTWWMRMPKDLPRTIVEAVRLRDKLAREGKGSERAMGQVSQVASMWDVSGQPSLLFRNEPWCNGAVWSLNPNPHLPTKSTESDGGHNAATIHWNNAVQQELYGPAAKGQLDGEYLDSLEGYVTADLNFRREHFRYTTVPLTFDLETKQPALFKGLAVFEFTKWFCQQVHELGKLTFANGVPYRFTYLCPWLDVLGTETDWVRDGQYHSASDEQMSLWRTMSGAKPYLLLMNTDYDVFDSPMVEKYVQRSLFYGMFPGMFSHNAADNPYWQNPKWYNRDRPLFKKYIPLVKQVAEAGWQPVTDAECGAAGIFVERFGPNPPGAIFFTLLNDTATRQVSNLRVDLQALGLKAPISVKELISGQSREVDKELPIELQPQEVKVFEVNPSLPLK